jgi:putative lipoic acid-binding regulatory protein
MKNIGSIIAISYALASDISSISSTDDDGAVDITFSTGKAFTAFSFTPQSASFNEEQQDSDAGPYFSQSLSFRCPKVDTIQHAIFKSLVDQELILKVTDGNGTSVIMGTLETPARCSWRISRPSSPGGYNGYEVSFKANCIDPAPFLDESFEVS